MAIGGISGGAGRVDHVAGAQAAAPSGGPRTVTAPDFGRPDLVDNVSAKAIDGFFSNTGVFRADIRDFRSAAEAQAVLKQPLATPPGQKPFGPAVVYRPGFANTTPSAAYLFRMAQYTDKVLVAYANAKHGQDLAPRQVDEIFGVPVPPELRGKIWVSGDPEHRMLPWKDDAHLLEKQLEALDESAFLGGADLENANLTLVGFSAGGAGAVEARRALEAQGRGGVIGKLVNVATPMRGTPLSDESFFGLVARGLQITGGKSPKAMLAMDPEAMARAFPASDARLVDLAVTSALTGDRSNARPLMKGVATAFKLNPFNKFRGGTSDGWVPTRSMEYGRTQMHLGRPYDHAGINEDPRVVDDIARRLAGMK
jgi:hypothetical protein